MGNGQNQSTGNQTTNDQNVQRAEGLSKTSKLLQILVLAVGIIGPIVTITIEFTKQGNSIDNLNRDVAEIKENYESIDNTIDELTDLVSKDHEIFLELSPVRKEEEPYDIEFKDSYYIKMESVASEEYLAEPSWEKGSIIAKDVNGDGVYRDEDLYNMPIITSYLEGDNEVYFYGKFNENNHWNGKCILNVYNGNNLVSIFEGVYDDGELFSYKRVSIDGGNTWTVNDRIREGDYNSGETWIYEKTDDFVKGFSIEDVKEKQILTVDRFLDSKGKKLLGYYKGNTSNGLYNDDNKNGSSYLVKYKEDGAVDYLYVGRMKDGYPHDNTGNAWSIGWGYEGDGYYYYEGIFDKGKHGRPPKNWKPMTEEEIREKVNPEKFKCLLTGLVINEL